MGQPYPYTRQYAYQYRFVSHGKERIEKIAEFRSTPKENVFAFAFGDLQANGTVDVYAISNNGDMLRVLATVILILNRFLTDYSNATVFFTGSTDNRTCIYQRILKTYYPTFSKEFAIRALVQAGNGLIEIPFDPSSTANYLGFYINSH